jgi:tripartite-type tricarboxylate transporter receptor subunit TctC
MTWAQTYPTRPITMIVPFAAGSGLDVVGRIIAERMRERLGQPIIIENIAGADGSIGTDRAARAKPDGYTINVGSLNDHVLNGAFYSLNYDLLNGFAPISPVNTNSAFLYAKKTVPARDLTELIAWLKSNPNVSAGSSAVGWRLLTAVFQRETGTRLAVVPYRGSNAVFQDLMGGQIEHRYQFMGRVAAGAGRQPQNLCCDKQHASDRGTGYSHFCRTGISPGFDVAMERPFRAEGHAKRCHR